MAYIRTHYDNLQISKTACIEVIRGSYKHLSQKYHPDKNPPEEREKCEKVMRILNDAYCVLTDPVKKKKHDEWIKKIEEQTRAEKNIYRNKPPSAPVWHVSGDYSQDQNKDVVVNGKIYFTKRPPKLIASIIFSIIPYFIICNIVFKSWWVEWNDELAILIFVMICTIMHLSRKQRYLSRQISVFSRQTTVSNAANHR